MAVGGRWMALATTRDRNAATRCEIALLEIDDAGRVMGARMLPGPDPTRDEKNWMPFVDAGRLLLVYSVAPTVILEYDLRTSALRRLAEWPAPDWARGVRGGSQGISVEGGWLFVAHEVVRQADPRVYVHRFVQFDQDLRLVAASPRFTFTGAAVEMCLGLAARNGELVLTYGVQDATAWIAVVEAAEVLATLAPV
jgi:predicted GH43/DUF377 family glycosyl hydrolase